MNGSNIPALRIVEGVAGMYAYHLSMSGKSGHPSLCGVTNVMSTALRDLRTWNSAPSHIRSKYCAKCSALAASLGVSVPAATAETITFGD